MKLPSTRATRTEETGPSNGMLDMPSTIEAAVVPKTSAGCSRSAESVVSTTWISRRKPLGKSGRIGRSVMRAARIASLPGRPSRRKNEPGIFPIAYIRSSKSIVSGKKSMPSRASSSATVDRIIVSP